MTTIAVFQNKVKTFKVFIKKKFNLEGPSHVCISHGFLQNLFNAAFRDFLQPNDQQVELPVGAHQLSYVLHRHLRERTDIKTKANGTTTIKKNAAKNRTHLAVHVPCDNADTKRRAGGELTGFLNPDRLDAFMSSILFNGNHAIAVQLTESPAIPLVYIHQSYGIAQK